MTDTSHGLHMSEAQNESDILDTLHGLSNVFKLLLFYVLIYVSHVSCTFDVLFLFTCIMCLECNCFGSVFMFYSLFHFIIDVLRTVDSGLCLYIHIIMETHLPIKGQKYEQRYVCVLWFEYKYT